MSTTLRVQFTALLAALVIAYGAISGCADFDSRSVRGSGVVATDNRDVSGFSDVRLSGSGEVIIEQTGTESLSVEADDNILPLLETTVDHGVLRLGTKSGASIRTTRPIRYRITARNLTGVGVAGSGSVRAAGVDTDRLSVQISGSGSADLSGRADDLDLRISGSGSCDAADLGSKTVRVTISGSGDATVNASDRLAASISGSGSVHYTGNPTIEKRISGSGTVAPR